MARFFNQKKVELLAPSGNMEIFESVVRSNCDAVYIGGKSLNMRMIRKGFNFSDEEVAQALRMAHDEDKKLYVTVNNMLNDREMQEATEYLGFLNSIKVDGIIVQDTGVLEICKEQGFNQFEIHSSVMMNVHNIASVDSLKEYGVSRVVLSREMDLKTAKNIQLATGMETEYFVHGDICTVNDANCYHSSVVLGNSSNRGRCFKPCRWKYQLKKDGKIYPTEYPLAAKDMYMYEHIPELIEANITSFKIEGRMRETDFIIGLINIYGDAIDRYIEDPLSFDPKKDAEELFETRKRDFTTGYAFSKPGLDFINTRYEGTGKFYSTGKVFSTPTEEPEISQCYTDDILSQLAKDATPAGHMPRGLSVKVNDLSQAKACIELGVERIYLTSEVFLPASFPKVEELEDLVSQKRDTKIYLDLPQSMNELNFDIIDQYLERHGDLFQGIMVSNLGAAQRYAKKYETVGNFNLNVYNRMATKFYRDLGLDEITLSIETRKDELSEFVRQSEIPVEIIAHGPIKTMYLEHDLYENAAKLKAVAEEENRFVDNDVLVLKTEKGENPVYVDQYGRNHLYTAKEICLLPILQGLAFDKPVSLRIEGQTYTVEELKNIIQIYQKALKRPEASKELFDGLKTLRAGYTFGAMSFWSKE